jgi:uncharacterized repeat protein (TIGR03803 family)
MSGTRSVASAVFAVAITLIFTVLAPQFAEAQTFTVLHAFKGGTDGFWPDGGLGRDASGNLYGVTNAGGGSPACHEGCGTIYKVDTHNKETILYSFTGGADGSYPFPVVLDAADNLYGTTIWGGNPNCDGYASCGVVFKLDTKGKFAVLHTFTGGSDGANPEATLVLDAEGNLYGTTLTGGAGGGCANQYPPGCGVVFKVDKSGNETILLAFDGTHGSNPSGSLLLDEQGTLFGTTTQGGIYNNGTVFKLKKSRKEIVLHNFTGNSPDAGDPYDGLVRDSAGNLYGTTEGHPEGSNIFGTVFKLSDQGGPMTELFSFDLVDGGYPLAGLVREKAGNLYGTTNSGGGGCQANVCGTVYKVDKNGNETILYNFQGKGDGGNPGSLLVLDGAGNLYGTSLPGAHNDGVVFEITP